MKRILSQILLYAAVILTVTACTQHDEPMPSPDGQPTRRAILVYGAAYNSLSANLADDMSEMLTGYRMAGADADSCRLFVYRTDYTSSAPQLLELTKDVSGLLQWQVIKEYDAAVLSTSPQRMSDVIADFQRVAVDVRDRGLVLWSHAAGWNAPRTGKYWFGDDTSQGNDSPNRHMDIADLCTAIPRGLFSFVWADCCHMGGIEVAYQLRNVCTTFVAYPTEVLAEGMPYDEVLPHLLQREIDFPEAAAAFFRYYDHMNGLYRSATISVVKTARLESLAQACRRLIKDAPVPSAASLQQYHRSATRLGPYYDLRDICRAYAAANQTAVAEAESAISGAVIYAANTGRFLELTIDDTHYCGLSANLWCDDGSAENTYYKTLDWFKAVYQ